MTQRIVWCAILAALAAVGAGCRGPSREAETAARDRARQAAEDSSVRPYAIQPGDTIEVKFAFNPDFDAQLPVRPDGKFALPLVGDIEAAGATPGELRERLTAAYEPHLRHPELTVNVMNFGSNVAYIGGEVRNPDIISLGVRTSAFRAIMAAGGSLDSGNLRKVVIVRDNGSPHPDILMVDLSRGVETLAAAEDVWLQPRDMVFVPKTGISKANQFIREYIRDMLPIQSSFSLQYQFTELASGSF